MRYQKVFTQIWNDEKFEALSPDGQRLFLYLLTSPHSNLIGMYVLKMGYATEDLHMSLQGLTKALQEVLREGLISYDEKAKVVYLKNYLKHNPITNPNQVKAGLKILGSLPKSFILQEFKEHVEALPEGLTKGLLEGLGEAILYSVSVSSKDLNKIDNEKTKKKHNGKTRYGEFVLISKDEYDSLVTDYGKRIIEDHIEQLNDYIGSTGKRYKSHSHTIRSWLRRNGIAKVTGEVDADKERVMAELNAAQDVWKKITGDLSESELDELRDKAVNLLEDEFPPGLILQPLIRAKMIELYGQDKD